MRVGGNTGHRVFSTIFGIIALIAIIIIIIIIINIIIILIRGTLVTESSAQSMESLPSTSAMAVTTHRLIIYITLELDNQA